MTGNLLVEQHDHVALVSINRPPANYFDFPLIAELAATFTELADHGTRAIVLASEGKHFCAGANFAQGEMTQDRSATSARLYREAITLFRVPVPVIAAVQGSAVGGGLGLACAADFRVASSASRFHANFSMLGFHQGFALSESLPAIVGQQQALDMLYTSRRLDGVAAHRIGLADRLVDAGQERSGALDYAQEIAKAAPLAVRSMKATLRGGLADRVETVLERELSEQDWLWQTEDSKAAIEANLRREQPVFHGR